jgi:hypothetical protein
MLRLRRLSAKDRGGLCFGLLMGIALLVAGPQALACCENAECAFETCCYANGTCMDVGTEYKRCQVGWFSACGCWFCSVGASCQGDECDLD